MESKQKKVIKKKAYEKPKLKKFEQLHKIAFGY